MAISHRGTGTSFAATTGTTTTVTGTIHASTANGDVMWWAITGNTTAGITTPAGWNAGPTVAGGTAVGIYLFWRVASSEPASYTATVPSGRWTSQVTTYAGVNTTTPEDVTATTSTVSENPPSITPTSAGAWVVGFGGGRGAAGGSGAWSSSNGTLRQDVCMATGGTNVTHGSADFAWTAGAFDIELASSYAITNGPCSIAIALRPSVAGAVSLAGKAVAAASAAGTLSVSGAPAPPAAALWTAKIEVAFSSDPMAATPSWTNITAYALAPYTTVFGRPDEFSEVQPATLQLPVNNTDGRFTMGLTTGAYYPNVKIGKRIRVTMTRSGVDYVRYDGHVNNWPTEWLAPGGAAAISVITATDRFKRLGRPGELRSMLEEEVLRDTGTTGAYYPLSEPAGSTSAASIATTPAGTGVVTTAGSPTGDHPEGTVQFGDGTGPGTDGLSAPVFYRNDRDNGEYLVAYPIGIGTVSAVTLECWFATTATDAPICALTRPGEGVTLFIDGTGHLIAYYENSTALLYGNASTGTYNNARTHHVVVTLDMILATLCSAKLYIDGVQSTAGSGTFSKKGGLPTFTRFDIGGSHIQHTVGVYRGTLSHVAAYSSVLSAARIAEHYHAGHDGLAGERTDQRIGRFADYIALPAADRALDVGAGTVGAQSTSGMMALEAMQAVEKTEDGVLFLSAGVLTFHNRTRRYNTSPAVTLTGSQLTPALQFPGDDFGLTNDMTVTRPAGSPARAINQTSIDAYGLYRDTAEVVSDDDDDTRAAAEWRVNTYGTPRTRTPTVTVDLHKLEQVAPTQVPLLLAATIGTKFRLSSLPAQAPAATVDVFVEGLTETFDTATWTIEFNTSPADTSQVWQLGTAGYSELGTTTKLGF